jgi:hypothetical protein
MCVARFIGDSFGMFGHNFGSGFAICIARVLGDSFGSGFVM